jgi:hypothetical protein
MSVPGTVSPFELNECVCLFVFVCLFAVSLSDSVKSEDSDWFPTSIIVAVEATKLVGSLLTPLYVTSVPRMRDAGQTDQKMQVAITQLQYIVTVHAFFAPYGWYGIIVGP